MSTRPLSPFFIVGSGRSGTTLLRLLLNGHSKIWIPPETWFALSLVKRLPLDQALNPDEAATAVALITADYRWPDLEIDAIWFHDQVMALKQPRLADILDVIYAQHLARNNKTRLGDKTPPYIRIVPQLARIYPAAKFVNVIRDGRDVAASFVDAKFDGPGTRCHNGANFEWIRAVRLARTYSASKIAGQILNVRYESLVTDTEKVLCEVCEFLGEEFEPRMLEFSGGSAGVPSREIHIHPKLQQPISGNEIGLWQRKMSPLERFVTEACLKRDLLALGYPLARTSAARLLAMSISAPLLQAASPLLTRAVPYLQRHGYLPKRLYL